MSTSVSIRLPEALAIQLDEIARKTERSRAYHIQKALETYLEHYADLQIALGRLHDQTDKIVSDTEMRKDVYQ